MSSERARRVEELYHQALDRKPEERAAFLAEACAGDEDLRREIESLLAEEQHADSFMALPAIETASRNLAAQSESWTGRHLGHYELHERLGAGGMGQVYKAVDLRLGRTVAIKILAEHVLDIAEARQRLEREAKTIAQLSHPHICVLHDIGHDDGVDYLVMEYLEGVTLAERLAKGALPLSDAVKIALEVGDAVDKAHQSGVVHRDLKPSNIMLTPNGAKLLDFGVAKVLGGARSSAIAPVTDDLTRNGVILGTLRYTSPEQLNNHGADARSDIFGFGAVLYEMLTGKQAFQGKNPGTLISAVISGEPTPPSQVNSELPVRVDHVISRCLAKDPAHRWHSVRDAMLELSWAAEPPKTGNEVSPDRHWRGMVAVLAIVFVSVLAGIVFVQTHQKEISPAQEVRFEIPMQGLSVLSNFAVSPDGRHIVYAAQVDGKNSLWVRDINSVAPKMLPGTEGARFPDWFGDGNSIVFATGLDVQRIDVSGIGRRKIGDLVGAEYRRSTSNPDGVTIFGNTVLRRIDPSGGPAQAITELDKSLNETYHGTPWFLPDGRHFLYQAWSSNPANRAIFVGSLDSPMKKRLMTSESKAEYMPGFLLFVSGGVLMARPFDADRLEFTGEAVPVAEDISFEEGGPSAFYASRSGTLIYQTRSGRTNRQLLWLDRKGNTTPPLGQSANAPHVRLSPDGKRIAYPIGRVNLDADIWIHDIERDLPTRVTTQTGGRRYPVWSPDGSRIAFGAARGNPRAWGIHEKASNGTGNEKVLLEGEPGFAVLPDDWSSDGRHIVFEKFKDGTQGRGGSSRSGSIASLWILPLYGDSKPISYLSDQFDHGHAVLSPNGRWLAYVSNESGSYQVFVQSFPNPTEGKWQISTDGGMAPHWKRDGREIYYLNGNRRIVAVPVMAGNSFAAQKPEPLFSTPLSFPPYPNTLSYDVAPDGQRFLISAPVIDPALARIMVVLNWTSAIEPKVAQRQ